MPARSRRALGSSPSRPRSAQRYRARLSRTEAAMAETLSLERASGCAVDRGSMVSPTQAPSFVARRTRHALRRLHAQGRAGAGRRCRASPARASTLSAKRVAVVAGAAPASTRRPASPRLRAAGFPRALADSAAERPQAATSDYLKRLGVAALPPPTSCCCRSRSGRAMRPTCRPRCRRCSTGCRR